MNRVTAPLLVAVTSLPLPLLPLSAQSAPRPWQATDYYKLVFVGSPRLAPDGRRVAFPVTTVVEDKDRRHSEIWIAPTDGSAPATRYTSPATEAAAPVWSPDGTLLAFTSKREGFEDDVWFLRTTPPGGEAFQIRGVHGSPRFSADGRRLLYGWRGPEPDSAKQQPWRERVSPTAITRGPDPKRFDGRVYTSLPFLADERGLIPPRETRRPSHLYVVPLDGGDARQLTSGALGQTDPDWSPDGSSVVYVEDPTDTIEVSRQAQPQLWIAPLAGGPARRVETGYVESRAPKWSPDGRTIAFICSKGRGLKNDVCVIPAAGGTARNLTAAWSLDPEPPTWSPEGRTIYFSAETRGNEHLFAVEAGGGPVRQVTSGERTLAGFSLSREGKVIAYSASDVTHPAEIYVTPLSG
ncbi:MAG TPA: hypothetical protein VEO73_02305, partial [Gemmatimonadales bacterium]|nr:hypothetical protein [Gemmatimonadales bacterium]